MLHLGQRQLPVHNHSPGPARRPVPPGTLRGMRARLVPVLLALSVSVGACSDGGEEPDAAPTLPPITESPSPSPEPDVVPSEATAATPEGAAEFVRFFYEAIETGYQSRDATALRQLSADDCTACSNFVATIESLKQSGSTVRDDYALDFVSVEAPELSGGERVLTALVVFNVTEYVQLGADGQVVKTEPAAENVVQNVTLERSGDGWRVLEVSR